MCDYDYKEVNECERIEEDLVLGLQDIERVF